MPSSAIETSGLLLFIRYAFMPNHLGYCGGNDNDTLLEQAASGRADERVAPLLAKFTGAFPYLQTIASANGIADPLDTRVVEAYWIGNHLLDRVEARGLYKSLEQRFGKQLPRSIREQVLRKAPQGAKPYHFFHVVDVYRNLESEEVGMAAMESCRISWGQVTSIEGPILVVQRRPLVTRQGRVELGTPRSERVLRTISGQGFADAAEVGDWVSIHWGWVCEVLDARKLSNLQRYTRYHLSIASRTI